MPLCTYFPLLNEKAALLPIPKARLFRGDLIERVRDRVRESCPFTRILLIAIYTKRAIEETFNPRKIDFIHRDWGSAAPGKWMTFVPQPSLDPHVPFATLS